MTARDRCPECDAPLATLEDHAAWLEAGEPDDYRPDLCWARPDLVPAVHSGEFTLQCMREPVDWRARALVAERERDELLTLAANIDPIETVADDDGAFGALGIAGQLTRIAASMLVTAVRLHPTVKTGICCEVSIEGRKLDVVAQWQDAPAVTNWVAFASDVMAAKAAVERERDEARRLAEQWRFNPWRGTTQSDPFPWEPTP